MHNFKLHLILLMLVAFVFSCSDHQNGFDVDKVIPPQITVSNPTMDSVVLDVEGNLLFNVLFADDKGLATISMQSDDLEFDFQQAMNGEKFFEFEQSFNLKEEPDSYELSLTALDIDNNVSIKTLTIYVAPNPASTNIFVIGDAAWNGWDEFKAMPMEVDRDNPEWYEITLYSDGSNDGIKFLGQLNPSPDNWGVNPANPEGALVNDIASEKIVLTTAGYNKVRFNPTTLAYLITPVDDVLPPSNGMFHIMGCGFKRTNGTNIDLCWQDGPSQAYPMQQDTQNPYLYRLTVQFGVDTDIKFNGNRAWDALDWGFPAIFDDIAGTTADESKFAPQGDVIWTKTSNIFSATDWKFINRQGTYELILDEYLQQAQIRKTD